MKDMICKATEYNWRRLKVNNASKLTSRANKTASRRLITASSYLSDPQAAALLASVEAVDAPIGDIMLTLCIEALKAAGIYNRPSVKAFIADCNYKSIENIAVPSGIFSRGNDVLGFIYQSLVDEGTRNTLGLYYTAAKTAEILTGNCHFGSSPTILDPCCGSGAFLLQCNVDNPEKLYGFDIDPIAVMIAKTNLLTKFRHKDFIPNIFIHDFIQGGLFASEAAPKKVDIIFTNPPWGADRPGLYAGNFPEITSRERASMVIINAMRRLSEGGKASFLLPMAILTSDVHSDLRKHLLHNYRIEQIKFFSDRFDGVFTGFFAIELTNRRPLNGQTYTVSRANSATFSITLNDSAIKAGQIKYARESNRTLNILAKIDRLGHSTLAQSRFALGIVTGNNKEKLLTAPANNTEPIFTGKEVAPLSMLPPKKFVRYDRSEFQQCAPDECYRAPEKLIYRFIARYPIVAYDSSGALTLNSANIIIPSVSGLSAKSICVMLNSALYRFYYTARFTDIKVLKGNLCKLPLPALTPSQDHTLSGLLDNNADADTIDRAIFGIFNITDSEALYIKQTVDCI